MQTERMYHGSNHSFNAFDYHSGIGKGNDQEGVGIYLTDDMKEPLRYGKHIYVVEVRYRKLVSITRRAPRREIMGVLTAAPGLKVTLTDWGENPRDALNALMETIMAEETAHAQYLSVWYEAYQNHSVDYLKTMVKAGYDGVKIKKSRGVTHMVVFDPKIIRIIGRA